MIDSYGIEKSNVTLFLVLSVYTPNKRSRADSEGGGGPTFRLFCGGGGGLQRRGLFMVLNILLKVYVHGFEPLIC